jgi:hypothetical protein
MAQEAQVGVSACLQALRVYLGVGMFVAIGLLFRVSVFFYMYVRSLRCGALGGL